MKLGIFHYIGITDNVDLRQIHWVAGNYDVLELENLYVFAKAIAEKRVGYCQRPGKVLSGTWGHHRNGFCVKKHPKIYGLGFSFNKGGFLQNFWWRNRRVL